MNEIEKRKPSTDVDQMARIAKMLFMSQFFNTQHNPDVGIAQIATKILAGRELGFGEFASNSGITIIKGKPCIGANLMASAVKSHPRYDYRVRTMAESECTIEFFEGDESIGKSTFTLDKAKRAGIATNDVWQKYPENMLFARAISNGVRWFCPDVFSGNAVYTPDELGADVDAEGNFDGYRVEEPSEPEPEVDFENVAEVDGGQPDEPFDDPAAGATANKTVDTKSKLYKRMHALGTQIYGNAWDDERKVLVRRGTNGQSESSQDLTIDQVTRFIAYLENKLQAEIVAA